MNQCDGCRRGLPIDKFNHHHGPEPWDIIGCTAYLYKETQMTTEVSITDYDNALNHLIEAAERLFAKALTGDKVFKTENGFVLTAFRPMIDLAAAVNQAHRFRSEVGALQAPSLDKIEVAEKLVKFMQMTSSIYESSFEEEQSAN